MARNFYLATDAAAASQEERLRKNAYDRAAREARRFLSGGPRSYLDIRARMDEVIADGRNELAASRIAAHDIEGWDTSCRIMFLLRSWRPS